jgi:hypothetical protein
MKKNFEIDLTWKQKGCMFFLTTIGYGLILYVLNSNQNIEEIALQAVFYGVLITLFFIFLFPWFMKKLVVNRIDNIHPELLENEKIEEEILANLFRGIEGVGGKIFLTNERLIFKSHSLNIQRGQTNIKYSEITAVEKIKTMKIINNRIKIISDKDQEYCFVVNDRESQIQKISIKLVQ